MKDSGFSMLRMVGLTVLGSLAVYTAHAERGLDPFQLYPLIRDLAESSAESFGRHSSGSDDTQRHSIMKGWRANADGDSPVSRNWQLAKSRARLEKRLNRGRYGDGYLDDTPSQGNERSTGLRYGSGYELRMTGGSNGASPAGIMGGSSAGGDGPAVPGGGYR